MWDKSNAIFRDKFASLDSCIRIEGHKSMTSTSKLINFKKKRERERYPNEQKGNNKVSSHEVNSRKKL